VYFGFFDIDLFASIINAKCPDYVFSLLDPGAIAIDAFTLSWADIRFFAFLLLYFCLEFSVKL